MLTLGPKKDGGPNIKFFESSETLNLLEGVRTWLMKNCKKVIGSLAARFFLLYTYFLIIDVK